MWDTTGGSRLRVTVLLIHGAWISGFVVFEIVCIAMVLHRVTGVASSLPTISSGAQGVLAFPSPCP